MSKKDMASYDVCSLKAPLIGFWRMLSINRDASAMDVESVAYNEANLNLEHNTGHH